VIGLRARRSLVAALGGCEIGHTYRRRAVHCTVAGRPVANVPRTIDHPCFPEVTTLRTTLRELTALVGRPNRLAVECADGPHAAVSWPCGCAAEGDDFYDLRLVSCTQHRPVRVTTELRFRFS
jgi:hypothetical protein